MNTTQRAEPTGAASLAADAETLLDHAIEIQGAARGWFAATYDSPDIDPGTQATALGIADAIDVTVECLGCSSQALHRAADAQAPSWQRHAPEPIVSRSGHGLASTETEQPDTTPMTPSALARQAETLFDELDQLSQSIETTAADCGSWLDGATDTEVDTEVEQHGMRAQENLANSSHACCLASGRAWAVGADLADIRDGDELIARIVDEAENGLAELRGHEASSTAHTPRAIDSNEAQLGPLRGGPVRDGDRGPALEQEPPVLASGPIAGDIHAYGSASCGWAGLVAWVPHRSLQPQANPGNLPPGWTSARRSQAHDACFLVHQIGRFPRTGLHPEPLAARQTAGAGRPRRGCRHRNGHQQPDGDPELEEDKTMRTIERPTYTGLTYPCGLCNEFHVPVAGDLSPRCLGVAAIVCSRCGKAQLQYGPCVHCGTGR